MGTVDIEVDNIQCKIVTKLDIDMLSKIQNACSFKVDGGDFIARQYRNKFRWDGVRKLFNIQTRRFPIGLLDRVRDILKTSDYGVNIISKRKVDDTEYRYKRCDCFDLRDYQKTAVLASLTMGNGVVKVATGGGKTVIAGLTIGELKKRTIFIVHTRDLMYQAIDSFSKMFPEEKIGQLGDGVTDWQNITVATMQTLAILGGIANNKDYEKKSKYDEDGDTDEIIVTAEEIQMNKFWDYVHSVQCVMMDEVQIVSSQTASKVRFMFEHANYAFGYSASPWRDDGSDLMIEAAFGRMIVNITASELIEQGYLVQPTIWVHPAHYDTTGNKNMKYVDIYKKFIVENQVRNEQVANDAIDMFELGNNVLILVTQLKHGKLIQDKIRALGYNVQFISGKSNMKVRRQAIQDMRDGKISIMIASTIADVGLDIPRLKCIIEAGAGKSSVTALQRLGRIMRPFEGKSSCSFITYRDNVKYIKDHIEKKKLIWAEEPKFIIKDMIV